MNPSVLHDVVDDPGTLSDGELLAAHTDRLADVIRSAGVGTAAEAADLPVETVRAIVDGDHRATATLDVETVATILSLAADAPDPQRIVDDARQALMLGMTAGVLNVDAVAGEATVDLEPREVQGMVEGRHPMTLREYVALQRVIASRTP